MLTPRLAIIVALGLLAAAPRPAAAAASAGADILARLGMGQSIQDGVVAGMTHDLARQGWSPFQVSQARAAAAQVIQARLPALLEDMAAILFHDIPADALKAEQALAASYGTTFSDLEAFWRHVLYLWKLQTADGVAQVAQAHKLAFVPQPQPEVTRPQLGPVTDPRPDAAQRYWQACYVAATNVDTLASQYMDQIRAANPDAPRAKLDKAETDIRAIFAEMMAKMEPLIVRGLSESLQPRQLDQAAQWCRRPVGEAVTATPSSALQPAISTWLARVIPEVQRRVAR